MSYVSTFLKLIKLHAMPFEIEPTLTLTLSLSHSPSHAPSLPSVLNHKTNVPQSSMRSCNIPAHLRSCLMGRSCPCACRSSWRRILHWRDLLCGPFSGNLSSQHCRYKWGTLRIIRKHRTLTTRIEFEHRTLFCLAGRYIGTPTCLDSMRKLCRTIRDLYHQSPRDVWLTL